MFAKALILSSVALLASAANYDVTVGGTDEAGQPILRYDPPVRLRASSCSLEHSNIF